ncbi:MAG: hypothetical protein ACLFVO_09385 [Chloroflexaceae bacterium]
MILDDPPTFDRVLSLARQLSPNERTHLIAHLTQDLSTEPPNAPTTDELAFDLPVLTGGTWVEDLPLRRADLYDDDERC